VTTNVKMTKTLMAAMKRWGVPLRGGKQCVRHMTTGMVFELTPEQFALFELVIKTISVVPIWPAHDSRRKGL